MANRKFTQTQLAIAMSVLSMAATVGATTAIASTSATNPFDGKPVSANGTQPATTTTSTDNKSGSTVEAAQQQRVGVNSTPANGNTTTTPTTNTTSSPNHPQAPAPGTEKSKDGTSDENSVDCELAKAQDTALEHRLEMQQKAANIGSKSYADMQKNAVARGCNINTKEILDLSVSLPTIRGSWGSIAGAVKDKVKSEMKRIQNELVERTCEVAEQVIVDAVRPVREMIDTYNDISAAITGLPQYVQDKATARIERQTQKLQDRLNGYSDKAQAKIDKFNEKNLERYQKFENSIYENAAEIGFDIEEASEAGRSLHTNLMNERIQELQANPPKAPQYYAVYQRAKDNSDNMAKYLKCTDPAHKNCTASTAAEYNTLRSQWDQYNREREVYNITLDTYKKSAAQGLQHATVNNTGTGVTTVYRDENERSGITFNQNTSQPTQNGQTTNGTTAGTSTQTTNTQTVPPAQSGSAGSAANNQVQTAPPPATTATGQTNRFSGTIGGVITDFKNRFLN